MTEVHGCRSSSSVLCGLRQGPRPPSVTQVPLGYCWHCTLWGLPVAPSSSSGDLLSRTHYKATWSLLRESPLISFLAIPSENYGACVYNEEARGLRITIAQRLKLGAVLYPQSYEAAFALAQPMMNPQCGEQGLLHLPLPFHTFLRVEKNQAFSSFSSFWTSLTHKKFSGLF